MIRNRVFWLKDYIKGAKVAKALEDIEFINFNPDKETARIKQNDYLSGLLNHAVDNTEFYAQKKADAGLNSFDIIDKNQIRDNYEAFLSRNVFDYEKMKVVSTSGSTGTPFRVHHSHDKVIRNYADNLFFARFAGYSVGDPVYYLRVWNEINQKSRLSQFIYNTYPHDISDMSDESAGRLLSALSSLKSRYIILSYGSALEMLADYIERNKISVKKKLKGIWVMSEPVNNRVREQLSEWFSCPVVLRYSNSENGFIAHQYSQDSTEYLMNTASYHIELVKLNSDEPAAENEPGRVVITDLFNYAVPFIRYDTGDIAVKSYANLGGNNLPVLKRIEGRKLDFITNTSGDLISPHTIDYAVRSTPGLIQFQLIQKGKDQYVLKLLTQQKTDGVDKTAAQNLKRYLGQDASIEIVFIDEIPVLASGKRKIVVNEYST